MNPKQQRQDQTILFSRRLKNWITRNITYFNIIFFELTGSAAFAYGVLVCLNTNSQFPALIGLFSSIFISLSLFLAIVWGGQFTGGHFNPAVTLGFMLKKQGRLPVVKGLVYMASQIVGAWIGTGLAWLVSNIYDAPLIGQMPWKYVWYCFAAEIVGTFIFVLFIQVATTSDTTFCDSTIQVYIFIPVILMLAREYSYRSQGLNPAFAIAFEFFYCAYYNKWFLFKYVWATFFGPFIGSLIAVLFFETFYRKFIIINKKRQQQQANYIILKEVDG